MVAASSFVEYVTVQLETSINRMRSGLLQPCLRAKFFQPSPLSKLAVSYFMFHIFHVLREREVERSQDLERVYTYIYFWCSIELEEQCWAFIDNDELFSEDTAFLLYLEAKKVRNTAVMELMVPRIMKFFLMLVSTKDFLDLAVDELCLLLKSNYISVNRYSMK